MIYSFGNYTLNTQRHELYRAGELVPLRRKAFQLLAYLLAHHDRVVTKDELFDRLWPQQFIGDATLSSCLREVRQAVGDNGREQQIIRTIRGSGYRIVAAVEGQAKEAPSQATMIPQSLGVSQVRQADSSDAGTISPDSATRPCRMCQHANPAEAQFCNACAAPLALRCRTCGQENAPAARFCHACAASLSSPVLPAPDPVSPSSPDATQPPDAELRQLTVLFCHVVGFTALSGRLDPEDLREVVVAYHATCREVVQRFDGTIGQFYGDGVLVYFGYPQAHEDDAQRAVWTGLGLLEALKPLSTCFERKQEDPLAVRIGIHTGLVVIGELGDSERHEPLALGETPNIAAQLQRVAAANQVVISAHTRRLVGGVFALEDLGVQAMQDVASPLQAYGVLGGGGAESRFAAATETGLTPLVGREAELYVLQRRWMQATEGEGQVVLLSGEAGIGKSRLLQTLGDRLANEIHLRLYAQCLPYYSNSAFYPLIVQLERSAQFTWDDSPVQKLDKLERLIAQATESVAEIAPLLAALLAIPTGDRYATLTMSPQRQKDRTIEALAAQWVGLSKRAPVLFLCEDVHWSDPTTLEMLDHLVDQVQKARVLVVMTYRPEFEPRWGGYAHVTTHALNRLTRRQVAAMITGVTGGKAMPNAMLEQIVAKTDGVPLFVEELTQTVLESGLLQDQGEYFELQGPLPLLSIPATLHDSLMARLDRLGSVKEVAQMGAVIGREFGYKLLTKVSPLGDEALQAALDQLVNAALLFRRGTPPEATYVFKHALVQDTAYASLLKSTRQQLHTTMARVLETHFPQVVESQSELLAYHYTEAGLYEQAIVYWRQAGEQASQRSAHTEAAAHLTKGLELLTTLPGTTEHMRQELHMQTMLGSALMATKGYSAVAAANAYARAQELSSQMEDTSQLFQVLVGLRRFHLNRGELQTAYELGEQLLTLATHEQDPVRLAQAHQVLSSSLYFLGQLTPALRHAEQGIALHNSQQHRPQGFGYATLMDVGIVCHFYAAIVLWLLGYPDQATAHRAEGLTLAQDQSHPFGLAYAEAWSAFLHKLYRETQLAYAQAESAIVLAVEQGFAHWLAVGTLTRGWALLMQGQQQEGLRQLRQGVAAYRATGAGVWVSYMLVLLADGYGKSGQAEDGLRLLGEAHTLLEKTGECWWEAELYRVQGELLLASSVGSHREAESCFQKALNIAQNQQAKSWELRSAIRLARLWRSQGKRLDAYDLLVPVYGWFTEGFDTADLQEAKVLLEELAG